MAVRVVKQLLAKIERYQISTVHLDQILALAAGASPSASLRLPDDLFVWREYEPAVPLPGFRHAPGLLPAPAHRARDLCAG